ncbi:unnamed protein product [Cuscuta europaea]|uniref:Uncharacterized protein n=1 Tax=Cuscuta europaea TaxID=41803 RepID=A0A9P0ZJM9_CUSEU|nr:unnamed protein product [Cuscuta europaea]
MSRIFTIIWSFAKLYCDVLHDYLLLLVLKVQTTIHAKLKDNTFTEPFATKELAWFMASALLSLPVIFLLNTFSAFFRKTPKKRSRSHHKSHTHRRSKRVHPEK